MAQYARVLLMFVVVVERPAAGKAERFSRGSGLH